MMMISAWAKKIYKYQNLKSILENKNVLIVEDNKINQMITKKMLENKGMFCHIVDNGEESVALLKDKNDSCNSFLHLYTLLKKSKHSGVFKTWKL